VAFGELKIQKSVFFSFSVLDLDGKCSVFNRPPDKGITFHLQDKPGGS